MRGYTDGSPCWHGIISKSVIHNLTLGTKARIFGVARKSTGGPPVLRSRGHVQEKYMIVVKEKKQLRTDIEGIITVERILNL